MDSVSIFEALASFFGEAGLICVGFCGRVCVMDNWEEKNEEKTPEQIAKVKREYKSHAIRLALFFIIGTAFTFALCSYLINPWEFNKFEGRFLRALRPYANLSFDKVNDNKPQYQIVPILNSYVGIKNFNTFIAYDSNNIYVYDSLDMQKLINKVPIDGEISNISCVFNDDSFEGSMNLIDDRTGKVNDPSGLYVFCQYMSKSTPKLLCLYVPSIYYYAYSYSQNPNDSDLKAYKDSYYALQKSLYTDPSVRINGTVDFGKKAKHPGEVLAKRFDINIQSSDFICCLVGTENIQVVCADDNNNLLFYDGTGNLSDTVKIGHKFIYTVQYYAGGSNVCIFDGYKMTYYYEPNNHEQYLLSKPIELINAKFLPTNIEHYNQHEHFFVNNNKLCCLNQTSNDSIICKVFEMDIAGNKKIDFIYKNYFEFQQKNYLSQMGEESYYNIDYKILSQNYLFCDIPDIYTNFRAAESGGFYISPALKTDNDNYPSIIMFADYHFFILGTRGIDEPVDEAHVTYEDGKLTIYFMNKTSIFRWQNSVEDINNLNLRPLIMKNQPINTSK